jgi:hypothetical protein
VVVVVVVVVRYYFDDFELKLISAADRQHGRKVVVGIGTLDATDFEGPQHIAVWVVVGACAKYETYRRTGACEKFLA